MTLLPKNETSPVFDREQYGLKHISTLDIVDTVAHELGLELPEAAPKPALVKTNQAVAETTATIKRGLWENPTLQERIATTIESPAGTPEDSKPEQEEKPAVPASSDDPVLIYDQPIPEEIEEPLPAPELPVSDQAEDVDAEAAPDMAALEDAEASHHQTMPPEIIEKSVDEPAPMPINTILKTDYTKPFTLEDEEEESPKKEIGVFRILVALTLLVLFVAIDCHCALHATPGYMLAVRLLVFALGLVFAIATAWRAAGKKLVLAIIIIAIFLFHFNNNGPVLTLVETYLNQPAEPEG